jgi:hypothetical protein
MKEFLTKHNLNLPFREYRDLDALSASFLNSFATAGVSVFRGVEKLQTQALSLGSAVDKYLLDPEHFYNEYAVIPEKPTSSLGVLYDYIKDTYYPVYDSIPDADKLDELASNLGLWNNVKDLSKRRDKITRDFISLIELIPTMFDKIPLSEDDELFIRTAAAYIKTDLNDELFSRDKFRINHYQLLRTVNGVRVKGEIDQLEVDFEEKIITITDIKTGEESADKFERAFYKYRYWLQSGLYKHLVIDLIREDPRFKNFEVVCKYIYISKNQIDTPVVYDVNNDWYEMARFGWTGYNGVYNEGFQNLIDDITWHKTHELYEYPREVYRNQKRFYLDIPKILL